MLAATGAAQAQFVNGNFEAGNLNPWNVNLTSGGTTIGQVVETYDIDGPGPLSASKAARFCVGNIVQTGTPQGIVLKQTLNLQAGLMYTFKMDWAVRAGSLPDIYGGHFELLAGNYVFASQASGGVGSNQSVHGWVGGTFTPFTTGSHQISVRITRPFLVASTLKQYIDNLRYTVSNPTCAADLTTGAIAGQAGYGIPDRTLDNDDFFFYLSQFSAGNLAIADVTHGAVAGQPGYGTPNGVINNDDFFYYLAIFATGC
jgi:hypothetical protein